jgi:phosphate transport system substrate-binding protein
MAIQARRWLAATVVALCGALAAHEASAAEITGAGSTFVYPVLSKWSADYNAKTGDKLNYQSIGSGGGIAQIKAATVDFGASDMPLAPEELAKLGMGQFPSVIGGIVPVVHVEGIKSGEMKLTGALLGDIYLGKVKNWNDPAIKKLNPSLKLPDAEITVVHRSDGSGTTFNWANYLSKVNPEWKQKVGQGTSVSWPVGVGGKGNEGVAAYVNRIKNSIGYVEYAYVLQNKMTYAMVRNSAGKYVKPDVASFQAAAATADWKNAKDFDLVMTNAPGAEAYPITATTWIIMYKQPKDIARSKAAMAFFKWCYDNGQKQAEALDYVPLPHALTAQIEDYWKAQFKL